MEITGGKMLTKNTLVEEYIKAHPKSAKLHERAIKVFSASGATHQARILDPFRPYVVKASGSKKWDVDGNEYIDYVTGHGALILGYNHPEVVKAVLNQVAKGFHYGENHELEVQWGELIKSMMLVAEKVEFCACGQEANQMAIRLARLFTRRKKVLRFEENFHGWADEVAPLGTSGIVAPEVKIIPMHDLEKLEAELATKQYAIVMTEGGGAHMAGQIPWDKAFINELSLLAKKYGTLWHIDEVVTGFRDDKGGWQSIIGVKPDITALGKCTGGGLAVGAVVGREDIFEAFSPTIPLERRMRHSGTWNSNPVVCASGVAACRLYLDGQPQQKATEMATYLREQGNKMLREKNISGWLYGRTIVHTYFGPTEFDPTDEISPPTKDMRMIADQQVMSLKILLGLHLLHRGISTLSGRMFICSAAHSKKDIDQTVEAFASSLDSIIAEGSFNKYLKK